MSDSHDRPPLVCDTCGRPSQHLRRDVIDANYDALRKKPLWNCDSCYGKKHRQRVAAHLTDVLKGRHLYVAGFMAAGKSKIGPILAELLDRPFIDTDERITETAGKSITDIFEQDGEEAFRKLEHDTIVEVADGDPAVIALGGGAVRQEENWEAIRRSGLCLCVTAPPEVLSERIGRNDERPLLAGLSDEERLARIREMLAEREPYYSRADVTVESSEDRTPEETTGLALEKLRDHLRRS